MKKVLNILIFTVICLGLGACAKKENATREPVIVTNEETRDVFTGVQYMEVDETFAVTNSLDVTLKSIKTTPVIEPTMYADYSYENDKEDKVFVDVLFRVENVGENEIKCREIAVIEAKNSDGLIYNESKFFLEYDNYTSLTEHTTLKGKEKTLFHAVVCVPRDETKVCISVRFNNATLLYDYTLNTEIKNTSHIAFNEEIESENKKIAITGIKFEDELHPSMTGQEAYTYYCVKDANNTYMIVELTLENGTDGDVFAYDFAKIDTFDGGKALEGGMWVCENPTGEDFDVQNIIPAKSTVKAYYAFEIPKRDTNNAYNMRLIFDLEEYWCEL